jgi:hypothetical protein
MRAKRSTTEALDDDFKARLRVSRRPSKGIRERQAEPSAKEDIECVILDFKTYAFQTLPSFDRDELRTIRASERW